MGFRFRRTIGILPGVRLNLGKTAASLSFGVRGARTTVGRAGVRTTVGMPGTGLSHTTLQRGLESVSERPKPSGLRKFIDWSVLVLLVLVILSVIAHRT